MITGKDIYDVLAAIVPLYVAMILAYASVRWWKIFTPDQCSGINRFVAVFAVPLLSFHFISSNNPYAMDYKFLAADSLQKIIILSALFLWQSFSRTGSLEWMITLFSLSTLPNTLVMGIPLLRAMYGDVSGNLMVQIVVLQSVIWYTLMLFMFEYRCAKLLIFEQFPETAASITSFHVDSDVISLGGREPLETNAQIGDDGKLHVTVRRSSATSRSVISTYNKSNVASVLTPRASNLTGVEIYSIQTSREPTPRGSSFNQSDFYAMFSSKTASPKHVYSSSSGGGDVFSMQSSKVPTPRTSNLEDEMVMLGKKRAAGSGGGGRGRGRSVSGELYNNNNSGLVCSYPPPNPIFSSGSTNGGKKKESVAKNAPLPPKVSDSKDLHMLIWSSSESPVSEGRLKHVVNRAPAPVDFRDIDSPKVVPQQEAASIENGSSISDQKEIDIDDMKFQSQESSYTKMDMEGDGNGSNKNSQMPPASVMSRLILIMVWRKLIRNPNTYSSLFGLIWSFISFRYHIEMPTIFKGSISILSDAGLGMAMFSLGLFMALQPKIIACGKQVATFSMAVRFLTGPAVMAACSIAIGIRGPLLHVAIVQAALPQGIVPFVFAKEYNVYPDILSTAVIFGMLIALPITILYYVLLGV